MARDGNFRKPSGAEGIGRLLEMNDGHRELAVWGLSNYAGNPRKVLDIGCGGGMFIGLMAERFPSADFYGIDYSAASVKFSREYNRELIERKRCTIKKASVSSIPFPDGFFDLVTAVETYFFWPDLENDLREASRVVSESGSILVLAESYPDEKFSEQNERYRKLYGVNLCENEKLKKLIESNGFKVTMKTVPENNWVVFVGKRI